VAAPARAARARSSRPGGAAGGALSRDGSREAAAVRVEPAAGGWRLCLRTARAMLDRPVRRRGAATADRSRGLSRDRAARAGACPQQRRQQDLPRDQPVARVSPGRRSALLRSLAMGARDGAHPRRPACRHLAHPGRGLTGLPDAQRRAARPRAVRRRARLDRPRDGRQAATSVRPADADPKAPGEPRHAPLPCASPGAAGAHGRSVPSRRLGGLRRRPGHGNGHACLRPDLPPAPGPCRPGAGGHAHHRLAHRDPRLRRAGAGDCGAGGRRAVDRRLAGQLRRAPA
jgi:hypothetical protein